MGSAVTTRTAACPTCRRAVAMGAGIEGLASGAPDSSVAGPAPARPSRPRWFPFCSERCQLADLGKWLDEEYRVSEPVESSPMTSDD